jgi:hypothetical protein
VMLCILRLLKRHFRGVIDAATAYWKGRLQSVYLTPLSAVRTHSNFTRQET